MAKSDDDDLGPPVSRDNPDLLGHEDAEQMLLDAFDSGRLPHAWMICGPRGIGKATLAYRFARYVLVHGGEDLGEGEAAPQGTGLFGDDLPQDGVGEALEPGPLHVSPTHPVFTRIAAGGHADFLGIERTPDPKTGKMRTAIPVDDVRGIGSFFNMTSAEGGWRVVVIDSADELNVNSANAVLKVLEEPPSRALLLLVSHNPGRLLPTIRSRCRKLQLKPLAEETVSRIITGHYPDLSADEAQRLSRLSEGSAGRAMELADEGGLELYDDLLGLLGTLPNLDVPALHKLGDKVGRAGGEAAFHTIGDLLRWWMSRLILMASGARPSTGNTSGDDVMSRLAQSAGLDRWLEVWEKINQLLARADGLNLDRKQVLLNAFLALEKTVRP